MNNGPHTLAPGKSPTPSPWHSGMVWSLGLLVISRVVLVALAPFAEPYKRPHFLDDRVHGYYWHSERRAVPFYEITPNIYLDMWARSDSWQYLDIAERGYFFDPAPGGFGTVACFPLYPLLIRGLAAMLGGHHFAVALVLSCVATWVASVLLFRTALEWKGLAEARLATLGLFTFPSAFFLTTVFPHSLFLALCLGAMRCSDRGWFPLAGVLAALAGATRAEGFVLVPALAAAFVERHDVRLNRRIFGLVVAPLGLVAYMVFLWWRFDDPLAFVAIHEQFGRTLTNPIVTLLRPIAEHLFNIRHFLTYVVAAWLVVATVRGVRLSAFLFGWLLFLVPLATGQYESIYRVQLTTFPMYLGLAVVRPRWLAWLQIALFAALQVGVCGWFIAGVRVN